MPDWKLTDFNNREIKVGSRVRMWDYDPKHADWGTEKGNAENIGTVTDLGDWDADFDDDLGRGVTIYPRVSVRFDDGTDDQFITCEWETKTGHYYNDPTLGKVEEIDVID